MANLTDSTNLTGTITLSKATGTKVTLDTDHKYLTKDIELTIDAPTTTATASGATVSYGEGWIAAGSTTVTDANLVAGNIKKDVSIFGVTGTLENSLTITDVLNTTGVTAQITADNVDTLITKNVTTNGTYTAASDSADGYSSVTVNVPNNIAWENIYDDSINLSVDWGNGYYYYWINFSETINQNSVWRITGDNIQYEVTATWEGSSDGNPYAIGNYTYDGGTGGTDYPFFMQKYNSQLMIVGASGIHNVIIEKQVSNSNTQVTWETVAMGTIWFNSGSPKTFVFDCTNPFLANETYRVTWGETQYICETQSAVSYDGYAIGNASIANEGINTEEPFYLPRDNDERILGYTTITENSIFCKIEKQIINTIPTQHNIYLEFMDETNTTIPIYYDSTLPTTALTAYIPTTYDNKIVKTASLDNVTYYTRPVEVWTTVFESDEVHVNSGDPYGGLYINSLGSTAITEGSIWRITFDDVPYITIATTNSPYSSPYNTIIGNPLYAGGTDDGTSIPVAFAQNPWSAWTGWSAAAITQEANHTVKFETTDALEIPANVQLVDYTKISAGYIDSHGDFIEDNGGLTTSDYILIKPTMTFSFVANPYYFIGFYDINKNALGAGTGLDYGTARQDNGFAEGILNSTNIPANTVYIRITGGSQSTETQMSLIRTA